MPATAVAAAVALLAAAGCGGTLEGKYRRGELTSTSTAPRAPGTSTTTEPTSPTSGGPATTPASAVTTTTASTSGNAAGRGGGGEPEGVKPDGTIDGSAAWRAVVQPSGGRHR